MSYTDLHSNVSGGVWELDFLLNLHFWDAGKHLAQFSSCAHATALCFDAPSPMSTEADIQRSQDLMFGYFIGLDCVLSSQITFGTEILPEGTP